VSKKFCFALICGGLLLFGSGRAAVNGQTPGQSDKSKPATSPPPPVKKVARWDLAGLRQGLTRDPATRRPLLLNFWATWCEPCRDEFPDLIKLVNEFGPKGLDFAAVSFDMAEDADTEIPKFLAQVNGQKLPVFWLNEADPEPAIRLVDPEWGGVIPETFLFDGDGKLIYKHSGRFDLKELRTAVEKQVTGK
jgi:thiol-disulfide isomerase/thioredoxin